jgi:hypothetical protein
MSEEVDMAAVDGLRSVAQRVGAIVQTPRVRRWIRPVAVIVAVGVILLARPFFSKRWGYWVAAHRGEGAKLANVDLASASLTRLNMKRADLRNASLIRTRCFETDFRGADLRGADLRWALLAGADLREADLEGAKLNGAVYDRFTRWPPGFNPRKRGATPAHWDTKVWSAFGRPDE